MPEFNLAEPYRFDPTNRERSHRGAAECRARLTAPDESRPLDADDPVRDAALRRARRERGRAAA